MTVTRPQTRPAPSATLPSAPSPQATTPGGAGDDTVVVVVATGTGPRAEAAARAAAELLAATAGVVVPTHAGAPDLERILEPAAGVYVLDPGRVTAWRHRRHARPDGRAGSAPRAMTAPGTARARLSLLGLLADRARRVRWITRPGQLEQLARDGDLGPRG